MGGSTGKRSTARYRVVTEHKVNGATYTPKVLSDFVASKIIKAAENLLVQGPLRILDPAVGDGELLVSLIEQLVNRNDLQLEVYGFETNQEALDVATGRLRQLIPSKSVKLVLGNFLEYVLERFGEGANYHLFRASEAETYDLIIANPPYVRTQIMGAKEARLLAKQFGLSGRVDLYYPFLLAMATVLKPRGIAGIIVSNRFMTTKSGAPVRKAILRRFNVKHVWDLGDTKLFNAAVLPSVLLVEGRNKTKTRPPGFTSIYETKEPGSGYAANPIEALARDGIIETGDGRRWLVQHGRLDTSGTSDGVWRITTEASEVWLSRVKAHTWGTFRDIGKIRVGVKTCADKVFIKADWQDMPDEEHPEILMPLTTHHIARRFKALTADKPKQILYPHEVAGGRRRAVDISRYPRTRAYLERHRPILESRSYVLEAGREWYEIWVPQDPGAWEKPKLVFRDIAQEPTFWIDQDQTVVNGDCYWLISHDPLNIDLLWLAAAIGNSSFIKVFYDYRFHNKLYAGRRRFITQYVEKFPLPDPNKQISQSIIELAKQIYAHTDSAQYEPLYSQLDTLVWEAFGLDVEEVSG